MVGINFPLVGFDGYNKQLELNHFDLLIDWGWFYFITKPMFLALDWFYQLVGNFGVAILLVTVLVKLLFFPLANKSYASMAKMKAVQPQMAALQERYPDDKVKQQQEMMELYKKEKINPLAGCCPSRCRSRCSSRSTRCCSSPSRCATRRSSAGSRTCRRPTRPTSSTCSACSTSIRRSCR